MKADLPDRAESRAFAAEKERRRRLRNRRQRELYGPKHRRRRRHLARLVERGEAVCARCKEPIGPDQHWDLGHDDRDPSLELPEHRTCNRAAANRLKTSREW